MINNKIVKGMFDVLQEGIVVFNEVDADKIICYINPSAELLLGIRAIDIMKKHLAELKGLFFYDIVNELLEYTANEGVIQKDFTFKLKGLSYLYSFKSNKQQIDGETFYFLWFNDITVNKKIEEVKGNFFSIMSHELKTPLTIILGNMEIIMEEYPDIPFIDTVYENSKKLEKIFNDLLVVSDSYEGKLRIIKGNLELVKLIKDCWKSVSKIHAKKQCEFIIDREKEINIIADRKRIKRVFTNILDNAAKFNKTKGNILCTIEEKNEKAIISIKDEGIGVSSRNISEVFDPFYQEEDPNTRNFPGIGIGLTVAREIVRLHRGKISVSITDSGGTEVKIELPTGKKKKNINILIVDDEEMIRKLLVHTLKDYNVFEAEDAFKGLEIISEKEIDLVLMDINLPGMDGIEATRRIKKAYPDISVCFISAQDDVEDVKAGMLAGGFDYIVKPFKPTEILEIIGTFAAE